MGSTRVWLFKDLARNTHCLARVSSGRSRPRVTDGMGLPPGVPPSPRTQVRGLRPSPPTFLWKVILGAAVLARVGAEQADARTRVEAEKLAEAQATAAARLADSTSLVRNVDSSHGLRP